MATFNQDFTKWEQDSFVIQFSIADAEQNFQAANSSIWWGIASASSAGAVDDYDGSIILTKTSGTFNPDTQTENNQARWINNSTLQVTMSRGDTENLTIQDYYHELVISGSGFEKSVVAAVGTFTLKDALFPDANRT